LESVSSSRSIARVARITSRLSRTARRPHAAIKARHPRPADPTISNWKLRARSEGMLHARADQESSEADKFDAHLVAEAPLSRATGTYLGGSGRVSVGR
jgi:hypothetical protein